MLCNVAVRTVLYEAACRGLPRVCLKEKPGVIGLILDEDGDHDKTLVHWGVSEKQVFTNWVSNELLEPIEEKNVSN